MKHMNIFFLAAAIAATTACIQEQEMEVDSSPTDNLVPISLSGTLDESPLMDDEPTRTVYVNRTVLWEESDAISVFFEGNVKQTFTVSSRSEDNASAVFKGLGVPGSYLAVYPDLKSNAYDGTDLTVTIPSEQTARLNSFDSGANVSVACSQDETLKFKNVGSLLGFRFTTQAEADKMASVTIRAKSKTGSGYVGLSGSAKVTLDAENTPVAGAGNADHVTIMAPETGFKGGTAETYFVAVYPFECAGFEVTMTTKNGKNIVLNSDSPASVARNTGLSISDLSITHKLPEEFEVRIDFSKGWPFKEKIVSPDSQVTTGGGLGEKYTYEHTFQSGSETYTLDLDFYIYGNGNNYKFVSPNILSMATKNSRITLPAINGKHLKSVKMEVTNGQAYPKSFNIVTFDWKELANSYGAYSGSPAVITFPCDYVRTEKNKSYYMQMGSASTSISAITLTYSKTLNGNNSSEEAPEGHFSLMQMTNAGHSQMMAYILKTDTGKVIVIDGGNAGEDTAKMRKLLAEKYENHVYMWWITHPHTDHIGVLNEILDDKQNLDIDYIMHSRFSITHYKRERIQGETVAEFYEKLDALTDTKVIGNIDSGAHYDIDGVCIDILGVTNEEITVNPYNNSSMILRFQDKDKTVVFLGDAGEECGDKVLSKYRNLLDCDYLQMAHHGQKGVRESFYKTISFRACLWPTPKWLWEIEDGNPNDWKTWLTKQWMNEKGIQEHHVMWDEIDWFLE